MTKLLIRLFIKNQNDTSSREGRTAYSSLAAIVGTVCNILLFLLKYIIGTAAASISIISDAFNNLSDSAGCIVTLIGCKMAAKPADKDHPYGHGRGEYLTSLIISAMVFMVGMQLLRESAEKIVRPEDVTVNLPLTISMGISVLVKLWMGHFYGKIGRMISSPVLAASAKDSRSDVAATSAAFAGAVISAFSRLPGDGITGVIVSLFIIKAGYELIRDTTDDLLGKPADDDVLGEIKSILLSRERILGVHDIMVHSYGPSKKLASCHAEVRSDERLREIHEVIDSAEREIYDRLGISMTIHMDPVDVDNRREQRCREHMRTALKAADERLHIHDFRIAACPDKGEGEMMFFDLVVPYDFPMSDEELRQEIEKAAADYGSKYNDPLGTVVTFDRE